MGLSRFELLTPRLSSVCSNQLSYRPAFLGARTACAARRPTRPVSPQENCIKDPGHTQVPSKLDRASTFQPADYQIDLEMIRDQDTLARDPEQNRL